MGDIVRALQGGVAPDHSAKEKPGTMHHDGDFGKYMENKNLKLREQFEFEAVHSKRVSYIFQGVTIFVNGLTNPSHYELKQLMVLHGGHFENYFSRDRVSHIVCNNLPDTKLKQMRNERKPIPIVKPEWIVASIRAQQLLPVRAFLLETIRDKPNQKKMLDFGACGAEHITASDLFPEMEHEEQTKVTRDQHLESKPDAKEGDAKQALDAVEDAEGLQKAKETARALRAACDLLKGAPKSSKEDPEFVNSYFRASRLHFIGTWRTRIDALVNEVHTKAPTPRQQATSGAVERAIVHLDMDCFFASAAAVGRPELVGRPLVVCHSNSARGTGEVSSANYEARACGIRAVMCIAEAKKRCPQLLVVPYEFDRYQKISEQVYKILLQHTSRVQPLSCDEAFLDVTGLCDNPWALVSRVREQIWHETGCRASAGMGPNMLLARLATKKAKPNGQCWIQDDQKLNFLGDLPISELPGVGWSLSTRLSELGLSKVRQVWHYSKESLIQHFGKQTGTNVWAYAHGEDARVVEPPKARKSLGAEVNWGIRFTSAEDSETFLRDLCSEVSSRLKAAGVKGKSITLKVRRRRPGAGEPWKFLGCGDCDHLSRTLTLNNYVSQGSDLYEHSRPLLHALKIPAEEIRGLGIVVARLESDGAGPANLTSLTPSPGKREPVVQRQLDLSQPGHPRDAKPIETLDLGKGEPDRCFHKEDAGVNQIECSEASNSKADASEGQSDRRDSISSHGSHGQTWANERSEHIAKHVEGMKGAHYQERGRALEQAIPDAQHENISRALLPPASQLDFQVLNALPIDVRRDVERLYGIHPERSPQQKKRRRAGPDRFMEQRSRQRTAAIKSEFAGPSTSNLDNRNSLHHVGTGHRSGSMAYTLTQVDPRVLAELPAAIRAELLQHLPTSSRVPDAARQRTAEAHPGLDADRHMGSAGAPATNSSLDDARDEAMSESSVGQILDTLRHGLSHFKEPCIGDDCPCCTAPAPNSLSLHSENKGPVWATAEVEEGMRRLFVVPCDLVKREHLFVWSKGRIDLRCAPFGTKEEPMCRVFVMALLLRQWLGMLESDLEQLARSLRCLSALGRKHAFFDRHATMIVDQMQHRVQRLYKFKLKL